MHKRKALLAFIFMLFLLDASWLFADEPRIEVMGLFRDKAIVKINGVQTLLKAGADAKNGVKLIRSSSKSAVVEVNGKEKELRLGSRVSTRLSKPKTSVVRIPSNRGMFKTQGLINGRNAEFLVDTGATLVSMTRSIADKLQIQYRQQGVPITVSTASKDGQGAWLVKLNSVTVGGITLPQVQGAVVDADHDQEILLGMSFLNRVKFVQEAGVIVLESKDN